MTFLDYYNVPIQANNPSQDAPNMNTNFASINSWTAVDHFPFMNNFGGYHGVIHQPNPLLTGRNIGGQNAWNPIQLSAGYMAISATKINGIEQLFSMNYTPNYSGASADTQLFSMTGQGGLTQLTGNYANTDGWTWFAGFLLQWGYVTGTHSGLFNGGDSGTVTFTSRTNCIPFPNNCWGVWANPLYTSSIPSATSPATIAISSSSISKTAFNWRFLSASNSYSKFFWVALGN